MATELELTTDERDWLEEALYELKGLRGWAWGSADFRHYEEIVRGIGGVVD